MSLQLLQQQLDLEERSTTERLVETVRRVLGDVLFSHIEISDVTTTSLTLLPLSPQAAGALKVRIAALRFEIAKSGLPHSVTVKAMRSQRRT